MSPVYTMFGYDASSSTLAPQRYAAGDRGPIEGLIRAKSKVLRGTIILGFVHPGGIFLVSPPPALKRSCLAVTCFAMNVINCNQTCTGEKVVFALARYGTQLEARDNAGSTPLMSACAHGHADVAEYLLDQGCDRESSDEDGWTSLHFAASDGHLDVVHVLFRFGARLDALTVDGRTAADLAIANDHPEVADAIRAEEIRRRDHGFKRDRSTIRGTEEHEAAKRPRVEEEVKVEAMDESDDDDDDDDDDEEAA